MKLWLIRHAKSSWSDTSQSDFDRPLNARGLRDGPNMQSWLEQQDYPASWIWTSTAVRARATAEFVRQGFSLGADHLTDAPELYHASPDAMLDVIQNTPADCDSVAVVAHNPGTTYLLNQLTGEIVTNNVPTFGVARLTVTTAWHEVGYGSCQLDLFASPKKIRR